MTEDVVGAPVVLVTGDDSLGIEREARSFSSSIPSVGERRTLRVAGVGRPAALAEERASAVLEAAATGFRMMAKDDFENQRLQFPLYDALYTYCKWKVQEKGKLEHTGP